MKSVSVQVVSPGNIALDTFFNREIILSIFNDTSAVVSDLTPGIEGQIQFRWFRLLVTKSYEGGIGIGGRNLIANLHMRANRGE
jgi:hypothetical protein